MTIIVSLQPNLGIPPTDLQPDPATPRAVLSSQLVAAAVASLPNLSPVLPIRAHDPDYCLSAKRKSTDDDAQDPSRPTKKAKGDPDALFGPLTPATPTQPVDTLPSQQNAVFDIAIEQAIAAALFAFPQDDDHNNVPAAAEAPSSSSPTAHQQDHPSRVQSPLASSTLLDAFSENNADQWKSSSVPDVSAFFEAMSGQPVAGPSSPHHPQGSESELLSLLVEKPTARIARPRPPPVPRAIEPPLWKLACRARVDHVIQHYGGSTIRATLAHEAAARHPTYSSYLSTLSGPSSHRSVMDSSHARSKSDLRLEIYTPSSFTASPGSSSPVDSDIEATESELEEDADMSFDLDWDSDSDVDEEEDNDCDPNTIAADEHESIMDVASASASSRSDSPSRVQTLILPPSPPPPPPEVTSIPIVPITINISSELPPLPRLASIPVGFLREYPDVVELGTPSRPHPRACGVLSRDCLRAQAQLEREVCMRQTL